MEKEKLGVKPVWYNRQVCEVKAIMRLELDPLEPFKGPKPFLYLGGNYLLGLMECCPEDAKKLGKRDGEVIEFSSLEPINGKFHKTFIPYKDSSQLKENAFGRILDKIFSPIFGDY